MIRSISFLGALALAILPGMAAAVAAANDTAEDAPTRPHIVLIVADDMGWGDVGHHDSVIRTPAIDALVARGAELDRFYAMPTCSPTRATLLTGQLALGLGVLRPLSKNNPTGLPLDRRLLPEDLRDAGYQTALVGKWHLGYLKRAHNPNQRGFESYYGHVTGGVGYWDHVHGGGYDWQRDGVTARDAGYTTRLITTEAERLIDARDRARPLFLEVAFNAPHLPNEAPDEALAEYVHVVDPRRRAHAAMVSEMDRGIARIMAALERNGMTENTIVWFMSDNGGLNEHVMPELFTNVLTLAKRFFDEPLPTRTLRFLQMNVEQGGGDNGPFRMGKQSIYEGGVRVPSVVAWPARIRQGRVNERVTVADILPTLLEAARVDPGATRALDGRSRLDLLSGSAQPAPAPDFIAVAQDGEAYYRDHWKLIERSSGEVELYDLDADPTEARDLAATEPALVAELSAALAVFPRGEDVALPLWRIILDTDEFGGEEIGPPMAERVRD